MKLDGGQIAMNFVSLNLYSTIQDSIENLKLSYPHKTAILSGDKSIEVQADRALFCVLITNLIENAFKYSEDEVHVIISKTSLKVIDTGIGINKKDLENITDKFYRVHKNSWNNSLGLGLFIVNTLTKLHNFTLDIESEENMGSTFTINF